MKSLPSFVLATARTNVYCSTRMRVSMSARPLAVVKWNTAAIGEGLLSTISQIVSMKRSLRCGKPDRMATGTIAASSARFGVSSETTPSADAIGAFANTLSCTFFHTALSAGSASCAPARPAASVTATSTASQGIIAVPPVRRAAAHGASAQYTRVRSLFPLELRIGGGDVALVERVYEQPVVAGESQNGDGLAQGSPRLDRTTNVRSEAAQVAHLRRESCRPRARPAMSGN